jgi:hypothetical protein
MGPRHQYYTRDAFHQVISANMLSLFRPFRATFSLRTLLLAFMPIAFLLIVVTHWRSQSNYQLRARTEIVEFGQCYYHHKFSLCDNDELSPCKPPVISWVLGDMCCSSIHKIDVSRFPRNDCWHDIRNYKRMCLACAQIDTIRSLDFYGCGIATADLTFVQNQKDLEWLDLSYTNCDNDTLRLLSQCTSIKELRLMCSVGVTDLGLSYLAGHKRIELLDLGGLNGVTGKTLEVLGTLPQLSKVVLVDTSITAIEVDAFRSRRPEVIVDY